MSISLFLVTTYALSSVAAAAPADVPVLMRLDDLRCTVRTMTVLRSREDFEKLSQPNPVTVWVAVPKAVDWRRHMVVVVGSGQRIGEGFSIRIERVEKTKNGLAIHVKEIEPRKPDPASRILSHPTDVVVVPAMNVPVRFVVNGFTERVWKPTTTRPTASSVDRDIILRRFRLSASARARLETAYRAYTAAREATLRWWVLHSKEPKARQQYLRRRKADAEALGAAIREVLTDAQYATFRRARALEIRWRRQRRPLLGLARNPDATETEKRACLEQIRALDTAFNRQLDALFRPTATTRPAAPVPTAPRP